MSCPHAKSGAENSAGPVQAARAAVQRAMAHAGSIPASEAVKLRPDDWHAVTSSCEVLSRAQEALEARIAKLDPAVWAETEA